MATPNITRETFTCASSLPLRDKLTTIGGKVRCVERRHRRPGFVVASRHVDTVASVGVESHTYEFTLRRAVRE